MKAVPHSVEARSAWGCSSGLRWSGRAAAGVLRKSTPDAQATTDGSVQRRHVVIEVSP